MSYDRALMNHLRRSLQRDLERPVCELAPDAAGSIHFVRDGVEFLACMVRETYAQVGAVAATGVKPSLKLLRELNTWNQSIVGLRAVLIDDGQVVLCGEVLAESIERGELLRLLQTLQECAGELGPLLNLVFAEPPKAVPNREVDR